MAVEFRVFGGVEVRINDRPIDVGYAQLQAVLAVLLVEANRPVAVDQLIDRVWGTRRLPRRPRAALQHSVSTLRRTLLPTGTGIAWSVAGYRLDVDELAVDLHRFRRLVSRARDAADDDGAADALDRALRGWHGEPFAGLDTPWFTTARAVLARQRLAAQLDLIDHQLRRGRHASLLPELAELAERHPLDERLAGQYLLALFRNGRQALALEHFERVRRRLVEHLGTDPSPPLRLLHRQILTADPALAAPGRPVTPSAKQTTGPVGTGPPRAVPDGVRPRQLPANPRLFTGRERELARLTTALDEQVGPDAAAAVSVIVGPGGIGKTWLALRWAHRNLHRFPDGQLHVNLRGFDPRARPVPATQAIRGFLEALGVDPAAIPTEPDAQVALYRSLLAERRMVIVLDNARDADQVEPLLPGGSACTALVTSRHRLTSLAVTHGARLLTLDVLTDAEAGELFSAHVGPDRASADAATTAELLAYCGGLPLAVAIVGARAARPDLPLDVLAEELRDSARRLDALDGGQPQTNVRTVLSWSCAALPPDAVRAFGLLGMAPGPDIGLPAIASLVAAHIEAARRLVRTLEEAGLVHQHRPGRFRLHDLVRLYASDRAGDLPGEDRDGALRRLVDCYLHSAFLGDRLLGPHRHPIELGEIVPGCRPARLRKPADALTWFHAEYANLLAAHRLAVDRGWHRSVWQLAWALSTFQGRQGRLHDGLEVWLAGRAAADHCDDLTARIRARQRLGHLYTSLGRYDDAIEHLDEALAQAGSAGDLTDVAHSHSAIAWAYSSRHDHERAVDHMASALTMFRTLDRPVWQAGGLNRLGWYQAKAGRYDEARASCEAALALLADHPDPEAEADTLDSLGFIAQRTGRPVEALDCYRRALTQLRELGYTYEEANTLDRLGQVHRALGEPDRARAAWDDALGRYRTQHRIADAARIERQLDELDRYS